MADESKAASTLEALAKNARKVSQGYANPTNPLSQSAEVSAEQITNIIPVPNAGDSHAAISKTELRDLAVGVAAHLGVTLEQAYLEDLYNISVTYGVLSERDVWLYLRGAMMANQISMTTVLSKLIVNVESILTRNQQTMASTLDSNKQILERPTLVSQKVEAVAPTICSMIQSELALIREKLSVNKGVPSVYSIPTAAGTSIDEGMLDWSIYSD